MASAAKEPADDDWKAVSNEAAAKNAVYLASVKLSRIIPSSDNPRIDMTDLDELARSIKEQGILEPLLVAPQNDGDPRGTRTKFDLIAGHRRLAAAELAGLKGVPVLVRPDLVGAKADEARLVENIQRADLSPIEEARAYDRLIRLHGYNQEDVAAAIARNQGHVSKRLALLRLPNDAQQAVGEGTLTINDGVDLARLGRRSGPAALRHALADIQAGTEVPIAIRDAETWASRATERTAAIKSLQKSRIPVIEIDGPLRVNAAKGPVPLELMDWVDPAEHAACSCHAAVISSKPQRPAEVGSLVGPVDRWAIFVCTEPSNHPRPDAADPDLTVEAVADQVARRARQERAELLQESTVGRRDFIAKLFGKGRVRWSQKSALEHLARTMTIETLAEKAHPSAKAAFDLAAEWLGAQPKSVKGAKTVQDVIVHSVMAGTTTDEVLKPALALRLALDELAMTGRAHGPLVAEHFRFLRAAGYLPTEVELEYVDQSAEDADR